MTVAVAAVLVLAGGAVAISVAGRSGDVASARDRLVAPAAVEPAAADPANLESLPEARYDAVIGGLIPYTAGADGVRVRYTIARTIALYGVDHKTAVAKLAASDFSGQPTTVVVVADRKNGWSLILTPARVSLPSKTGGNAAAQSAAWVRSAVLTKAEALPDRVLISAGDQKLRIVTDGKTVAEYAVGVGTPETPTPTNVTGYLQQRYLDAAQNETKYPIQLTSLHSSAADEPYGGSDGGLIGIHYNATNSGAVSHGCIRLTAAAIQAVNALPLGTPITITP
ncbi:L,D-transpeptidase [Microbacterium sp. ASV49]|uniref:L,D-transpeptidase n=1 Tax=Microbacterium candidum TaxID=3041922 RepID=A0ABT7MWG0_9MICO|nr:L,D-transpeptidase [Microbacterium sp. ASV49]MDL9978790.1 L,D-transpeptidase [Microbacterium sp. ASV49]